MNIKLAVIGNPVAQSRSPEIHAMFASEANVDLSYERLLSPLDEFTDCVSKFAKEGGRGFNVTVPFKHEAFDLAHSSSQSAKLSGAVNTVTVNEDGTLSGANTDGDGLIRDLVSNLGWEVSDKRILILGAGGAVAGILPALSDETPASIHLLNRTFEKARELETRFKGVRAVKAEDLESEYDLVISGSSAGLQPSEDGETNDIPTRIVGRDTRCYDMIYGKNVTPFNASMQAAGCRATSDGLGMLVEQAALAFAIWLNFEPETKSVIKRLRDLIETS